MDSFLVGITKAVINVYAVEANSALEAETKAMGFSLSQNFKEDVEVVSEDVVDVEIELVEKEEYICD